MSSNNLVDLSRLHTFGLSSKAKVVKKIESQQDISHYLQHVQQGASTILLGGGSNTVFVSSDVSSTVWLMGLKGRQVLNETPEHHVFRLAAGENWHDWVCWSVMNGYSGLENLALIPGTVGASPIQNIGAYGVELKERIQAVHGYHLATGTKQTLSVADCEFAYRDSIFKNALAGQFLITEVDFILPKKWQAIVHYADIEQRCLMMGGVVPRHVMRAVISSRQEKLPDPWVLGNSGSFFKNPIVGQKQANALKEKWPALPVFPVDDSTSKLGAGWMIDACGLKGYQLGGVQVYPSQALVLTNLGKATGQELLLVVEHIQNEVTANFGVTLEPEPILI